MKKLINWLETENIHVDFLDMDKAGMCVIDERMILVSSKISEFEQIKIIYHELKHFEHKDYKELYKQFVYHSKLEYEAEDNVVKHFIEDSGHEYNYSMLLEEFDIGMGYDTKYQRFAR